MNFKDTLETLPAADHLRGLDIVDTAGAVIHHIPAAPGKMGSLRVYHALAQRFGGALTPQAVQQGLLVGTVALTQHRGGHGRCLGRAGRSG